MADEPEGSLPSQEPAAAAPAAPAARPAAKPAAPAAGVTRRGFFSWAAVAWVGFTVAIGGCVTAMGRFMFPNVLFEPPTSFKVGDPKDFQAGAVDTRFVDKYGVWIVNDQGRIYALIAICTHLGCPPAWLDTQNKFKCPCHGSGYYKNGVNFEGPTPRPHLRQPGRRPDRRRQVAEVPVGVGTVGRPQFLHPRRLIDPG
jgi:cytochrome b6-f complex iron-sulfur subunit